MLETKCRRCGIPYPIRIHYGYTSRVSRYRCPVCGHAWSETPTSEQSRSSARILVFRQSVRRTAQAEL